MSSALRLKRQSALAALKARREGGTGAGVSAYKSKAKDDGSDSDNDLYDEVSEDEYKSIVRGRLMADDFIEDDDGSGYVDDGRDDWERQEGARSDDSDESEDADEYFARTGRKKKRTKGAGRAKKDTKDAKTIDAYSASGIAGSLANAKKKSLQAGTRSSASVSKPLVTSRSNVMDAYRPSVAMEKEDDFMKRLMGGLGDNDDFTAMHSPTPSSRYSHALAAAGQRKRKQEPMSRLARRSNAFTSVQRSPTTPPSSDPLDPPSDDFQPDVHITGSDTPPYATSIAMESDEPTSKRLRAASRRMGSMGIGGGDEDEDVKPILTKEQALRRDRSMSRIDSRLFDGLDDDAFMDDDDLDFSVKAPNAAALNQSRAVNASGVRAKINSHEKPANVVKVKEEPVDDIMDKEVATPVAAKAAPVLKNSWRTIGASLANVSDAASSPSETKTSAPALAASNVKPFEADSQTVRFFWTDYTEQQGIIYLIGKVKDQNSGRFVSACLQVEGVERCVYLMPREGKTEDDVYDEFDALRQRHGIKSFLGKWVARKYAFEMTDVPAETHYLKVKYGFDEPQLPLDFQGSTFSRAFGTNTSAFELFVVKRGIMGPCWLEVESADLRAAGSTPLSWCKVELSVDDAKFVKPFADTDASAPRDTPPLTVMSISLRTVVNHKENKSEIVAVAARTWKDVLLEDPTPPEDLQSSLFSCVRPLGDVFPANFERECKQGPTKVVTVKYERMLLNSLLAQIQQQDPDVIVGHEFSGVTLDILLHRMRDLRADHWSRIGRLRRQKWPALRQGFNLRVASGRLLADLASDTAKGMITSTTWSLTEMCASHLKAQREDIDPDDTASFFDHLATSPERLLSFVRHNEVDAYFQMALASKVQLLALTKQLTNLAGNSWSRTLNGGRAERNEYILLHEFHRQKYICPDKLNRSERELMSRQQQQLKANEDDEDGDAEGKGAGSSKKDKFKGGLVFDPKRGLWDKYILVMDFNSLYPSLIQEFNIDFTTVDRRECNERPEDVDKMPEIPSSDIGQGVLPRLISTLVARRRQVKSLMKDRNAAASKHLQWNIKQLALKLTANSMYGCLGFEGSRFYARPLAALTTFKGRETLTATKELAESLGLDVIYGDTDSVMINTNVLDVNEAKRIGNEFKKAVNERYRLLEIDIDGIFERMLLLQKKKYAAIKIDDFGQRATEIKGLDMKRREYCAISKTVSENVLGHILSGESTETVVEKIHEYLESVAQDMDKVALDDFIIYKRLSKKLGDYNEQAAKSLPHVQVAKRMQAKGISVRMGDVIPYVFCLGDDGSSSTKSAQAERAYHPDDLRRKDTPLRIDIQHYLSLQLLPPVERLCDSIEGTNRGRLAEHLGLDASKYQSVTLSSSNDERQFVTLDSQTPDEVRYASCEAFEVTCPHCTATVDFKGIPALSKPDTSALGDDTKEHLEAARALTSQGLACSRCDGRWGTPFVAMQLEKMVRRHISKYYQAWTVCTEPSCNAQSRVQAINARRCLVPTCRGKVVVQYSDKALYDQLCYLESLFDGEKYLERAQNMVAAATASAALRSDGAEAHANAAMTANLRQLDVLQSLWLPGTRSRTALETLKGAVAKYTARSGRRFVALEGLFGWMRVEA